MRPHCSGSPPSPLQPATCLKLNLAPSPLSLAYCLWCLKLACAGLQLAAGGLAGAVAPVEPMQQQQQPPMLQSQNIPKPANLTGGLDFSQASSSTMESSTAQSVGSGKSPLLAGNAEELANGTRYLAAVGLGGRSDEDSVISASEILTDSGRQQEQPHSSIGSPSIQAQAVGQSQSQSHGHNSADPNGAEQPDGPTNCAQPNALEGQATFDGSTHNDSKLLPANYYDYSSSRLIFQLLVVGLLILVTLSLVTVYTIKLCICSRRKHQLQRNLVTDVSLVGGANGVDEFLLQCTCPNPPLAVPPPRLHSLLGPSLCNLGRLGVQNQQPAYPWLADVSSLTSLYQQLALAERLALQHQLTMQSGSPNCVACLAPADQRNQISALDQSDTGTTLRRPQPPSYSDLFGDANPAREAFGGAISPSQATTAATTTNDNNNDASTSLSLSSSRGETGCASGGHTAPGEDRQGHRGNLLVKLRLNKTKLLSADDLMLLSKLIDVPIVVHEQQLMREQMEAQNQDQANQRSRGNERAPSGQSGERNWQGSNMAAAAARGEGRPFGAGTALGVEREMLNLCEVEEAG